jgi:hypothetical protein
MFDSLMLMDSLVRRRDDLPGGHPLKMECRKKLFKPDKGLSDCSGPRISVHKLLSVIAITETMRMQTNLHVLPQGASIPHTRMQIRTVVLIASLVQPT